MSSQNQIQTYYWVYQFLLSDPHVTSRFAHLHLLYSVNIYLSSRLFHNPSLYLCFYNFELSPVRLYKTLCQSWFVVLVSGGQPKFLFLYLTSAWKEIKRFAHWVFSYNAKLNFVISYQRADLEIEVIKKR